MEEDISKEKAIKLENIINENKITDIKNINLNGILKFGAIAQKAIGKIKLPYGKNSYGTGFFCTLPYPDKEHTLKALITNNHVLNKEFFKEENQIKAEINNESYIIDLNANRKIWTNKRLDYTIIEIIKEDNINNFLNYDENIVKEDYSNKEYKNESIFLPAIMKNQQVEFSSGMIVSTPNNCEYFLHSCNTDSGSSGGPILLVENFTVVAIHKGYDKENKKNVGIFLKYIVDDIKTDVNILESKHGGNIAHSDKHVSNKDNNNKEKNEIFINDKEKEIIEKQVINNICKIYINGHEKGIGFLCIIPYPDKLHRLPVIFIYSENLRKNDIMKEKEIKLSFQNRNEILFLSGIERKIFDFNNNIIVIELKKNDNLDFNECLEINDSKYENSDEKIYLLSNNYDDKYNVNLIKSTEDYKYTIKNKVENNYTFSPVLKLSNHKIIGIYVKKNDNLIFMNEIMNRLNELNDDKNEIIITLEIEEKDVNKEIYFLDGTNYTDQDTKIRYFHNYLKELNESNVKLYINDQEHKYSKYFIPEKKGVYTIKLVFSIEMRDCSYMFSFSDTMTKIDLSSFNTQKVTNMSNMFLFCQKLKTIDLSSFNTQNVKDMSKLFFGCYNLTTIDLSSFDTLNVKNMSNLFGGCFNLSSIDLTSFNTQNVKDMSNMFNGCSNLRKIDISTFNTPNVTNLSYLFYECSNLTSLDVSSLNTQIVTDMSHMFDKCSNLIDLDLSGFNTEKVTNMSHMFNECTNLNNLKLTSFNTQSVTNMDYMFYKCSNLTSLNLMTFNIENVTKMFNIFFSCDKLSEIIVNGNSLEKFQNENIYCRSLFKQGNSNECIII